MQPDDAWADLAKTVPGGFAGVFRDSLHRPVLLLTDPTRAAEAKQVMGRHLPFLSSDVDVRPARWDFAQLVDWFNYLLPHLGVPLTMADKDETVNRIRFSVASMELRDSLVHRLAMFPLPCDLVIVDLHDITTR